MEGGIKSVQSTSFSRFHAQSFFFVFHLSTAAPPPFSSPGRTTNKLPPRLDTANNIAYIIGRPTGRPRLSAVHGTVLHLARGGAARVRLQRRRSFIVLVRRRERRERRNICKWPSSEHFFQFRCATPICKLKKLSGCDV